MPWLYKHPKSKFWFIGWRVNKRLAARSTKTTDKKEALKQLANLHLIDQAHKSGKLTEDFYRSLISQEVVKVTFRKAVTAFLDQAPTAGTRSAYASKLNTFGRAVCAADDSEIGSIAKEAIRKFLRDYSDETSISNSNQVRVVLRSFFRFCKAEYHTQFPMDGIKKLVPTTATLRDDVVEKPRPFTDDELRRTFAVANPFWRFAMAVAFHTGFRLGAIATLRWRNVNTTDWSFSALDSKDRMEGNRTTPIVSPALREMISSILQANPQTSQKDYIFPDYAKKYLFNPNKPDGDAAMLSTEFRKLLVTAGLCEPYKRGEGKRKRSPLTFHSIKHNMVTTLKVSGASEMVAREVVGHNSQRVSDIYTHTPQNAIADALRRLPEIFTP